MNLFEQMSKMFFPALAMFEDEGGAPAGGTGTAEEIEAALQKQQEENDEGEPAAKKDEEPAAGKGKKDDGGKQGSAAEDDKEVNIEGFGKVKISELKKWKSSSMMESDYRKKTEELSQKEEALKDLAEFSDYLAKNPKKLEKVLKVLDEADEAAQAAAAGTGTQKDAGDAAKAAQDKIKEILEKIDDSDPASLLLKEMYNELIQTRKKVEGFEQREKELQNQTTVEQQKQLADQQKQQVEKAREVLLKTLEEVKTSLKLGKEEEDLWRQLVRAELLRNRKPYEKEEDFVNAIKATGDAIGKRFKQIADAALKKYLESKSGPTLPGAGAENGGTEKPKAVSMENLAEVLEAELNELNKP